MHKSCDLKAVSSRSSSRRFWNSRSISDSHRQRSRRWFQKRKCLNRNFASELIQIHTTLLSMIYVSSKRFFLCASSRITTFWTYTLICRRFDVLKILILMNMTNKVVTRFSTCLVFMNLSFMIVIRTSWVFWIKIVFDLSLKSHFEEILYDFIMSVFIIMKHERFFMMWNSSTIVIKNSFIVAIFIGSSIHLFDFCFLFIFSQRILRSSFIENIKVFE